MTLIGLGFIVKHILRHQHQVSTKILILLFKNGLSTPIWWALVMTATYSTSQPPLPVACSLERMRLCNRAVTNSTGSLENNDDICSKVKIVRPPSSNATANSGALTWIPCHVNYGLQQNCWKKCMMNHYV